MGSNQISFLIIPLYQFSQELLCPCHHHLDILAIRKPRAMKRIRKEQLDFRGICADSFIGTKVYFLYSFIYLDLYIPIGGLS